MLGMEVRKVQRWYKQKFVFVENSDANKETPAPTRKPPCSYCRGGHGVWNCRRFQNIEVKERWEIAKEKWLCFRCLARDHEGTTCYRPCDIIINGCKRIHYHFAPVTWLHTKDERDTHINRQVACSRRSDSPPPRCCCFFCLLTSLCAVPTI